MRALILAIIMGCAFTGQAACLYNCDENPWCDNDSYCLGDCECSLSENRCVPR